MPAVLALGLDPAFVNPEAMGRSDVGLKPDLQDWRMVRSRIAAVGQSGRI